MAEQERADEPSVQPECGWQAEFEPGTRQSCSHKARQDSRLCVFHDPPSSDDVAATQAFSEAVRKQERLRAIGWIFPTKVQLTDAEIVKSLDLRGARFLGGLDLSNCVIHGQVQLMHAKVTDLDVVASEVRNSWFMDSAYVSGNADLRQTRFFSDAEFGKAHFGGTATFAYCRFMIAANFDGTRFHAPAVFDGTVFSERTTFLDTAFSLVREREVTAYARSQGRADETAPCSTFEEADLTRVRFNGTRLRGTMLSGAYGVAEAEFDAAALGPRLTDVAIEERIARKSGLPEDFQVAEHLYRELRRSATRRDRTIESMKFQAREMEMRRLGKGAALPQPLKWLRTNLLSLEAQYRLIAGYGLSIWLPVVWLGALLLVSPIVLAVTQPVIAGTTYSLSRNDDGDWSGYAGIFGFTLRSAALLNDVSDVSLNAAGQAVQVLLRIVGPLLAVLMGFAIRRRFRA